MCQTFDEPTHDRVERQRYYWRSALQKCLADRSLAGLDAGGSERVLDVGCGDGKTTSEIATLLRSDSVAIGARTGSEEQFAWELCSD